MDETKSNEELPDAESKPLQGQQHAEDTDGSSMSQEEHIAMLSKRGYDFLKFGNTKEAEESFFAILELDPQNCYALVGLGDGYRQQRKYREAIRYYETCLASNPQNNFAIFGLADAYKSLNDLPKAIMYWEKYLSFDDKNVTVLTRIADAYRKLKKFEPSKKLYKQVLTLQEDNNYALIGLGHLYFDFEEYNLALLYWERAYRKSPETVDIRVLTSIGNCHRKLKTFKNGLEYFEKALERSPKNFFALYGMADCYRGIKDYRNSLIYWLEILKIDPKNKVIITRAADAYRVLGNYEEAEKLYHKALDINFDLYAHLGLALIDKEKRDFDKAIERLEFLLKKFPRNPRIYSEIAKCYQDKGDKNKALQVLESFRKQDRNNRFINSLIERLENE